MRSDTANSMLKFLEEPDNDIMAILMTNNFNGMLSTIISRCQIIRLNNDNENNSLDDVDEFAANFLKSIEKNGIRTIMNEQELLFNNISVKDRDKLINFFDKMIDMYYDIMKIMTGNLNIKYTNYIDEFREIANKNTMDKIIDKINYLTEVKDTIKNNVNVNLLIDSVIVNIGGN